MSREAMAMALDVLENYAPQHGNPEDICDALNALREALAEHPGDGAEHFHRVVSQLGKAACRVDDLVTLCRRLCRALKHIAPTHPLLAQVDEYMRREGLTGLPLREALAEAEKAEPVAWGQLGLLNGRSYLRTAYESIPYPPPADVVRNLNLVPLYDHPPAALPESAETWKNLYLRAIDTANGLTNYVEERPELRRAEKELDAIQAEARAVLAAARGKP